MKNVGVERRSKATDEPEFATAGGDRGPLADLPKSIGNNLTNVDFGIGKDVLQNSPSVECDPIELFGMKAGILAFRVTLARNPAASLALGSLIETTTPTRIGSWLRPHDSLNRELSKSLFLLRCRLTGPVTNPFNSRLQVCLACWRFQRPQDSSPQHPAAYLLPHCQQGR